MDITPNPGPEYEFLSIFHLNIRSLRSKISYLEDIANDYDVICVTESHLDNVVSDDEISIDGYQLFRRDRSSHGGGVAVYVSDKLHVQRIHELENDNILCEYIWIKIVSGNTCFFLCTVYRSPSSNANFWDSLEYSIDTAVDINPHIIMVGDLNVDLLVQTDNRCNDLINRFNFTNVITSPTRVSRTRSSLLDPILLRECSSGMSDVIPIDSEISDHLATYVEILLRERSSGTYKRKVWCYKDADFLFLNSLITDYNWQNLFDEISDADYACEKFTEIFSSFVKQCIPIKQVTIRQNDKPWFNSDLRREIRIRDRLWKKAKSGSIHHINKYKRQRNKVNNMKKYARESFFLEVNGFIDTLSCQDSKSFWKLVKLLTKSSGKSSVIPPLLNDVNGLLENNDSSKAQILNRYFTSISNIDQGIEIPQLQMKTDTSLSFIEVTSDDICDILKTLFYNTFILPTLEYASEVWDGCSEGDSYKLEKIHHQAARIVTGLPLYTSIDSLYLETGWMSLKERREYKKLNLFYKIHNRMAPDYILDILPHQIQGSTPYNLRRHDSDYRVPNYRLRSSTLSFLKRKFRPDPVPSHFLVGNRKYNVILTRLRNCCSSLNADLFRVNLTRRFSLLI
ncbi:hypothetical protein FSP39_020964 [Pinctada imbricata]|uniref:Endonuclease/exonuclease/phosphatase domain-containing protein n=1 Tax=Pinctada imbricata TaxID=66713 RepID=A0AA88XCP3_PINIB|nr:hypothetical protein FSP39_020964 [Pinctada imbricata]